MAYHIRHTVHILSLPTQYTQLTRYKCILRLYSYIFKEVKHESLVGELCVFNRHPGEGVYHMYKTKGPYNLMVTRARCSIVRTFGRLLSGNFHTYSIPHVDVLFCIVLYRQRFFNLARIFPTSANALSCSSPLTLASL